MPVDTTDVVPMEIVRHLVAPVDAATLFAHVDDLSSYVEWMPLVHAVETLAVAADEPPAWRVELRARVGPLARSKRLRMERTEHEADRRAVFERNERDGRHHSAWTLRADLTPLSPGSTAARQVIDADDADDATELAMSLSYSGALWSGPILQRVLDDEVRRGSDALLALVR